MASPRIALPFDHALRRYPLPRQTDGAAHRRAGRGAVSGFFMSCHGIAEPAGTRLPTVSRPLPAWRAQEIVIGGRHGLTICDRIALERIDDPERWATGMTQCHRRQHYLAGQSLGRHLSFAGLRMRPCKF